MTSCDGYGGWYYSKAKGAETLDGRLSLRSSMGNDDCGKIHCGGDRNAGSVGGEDGLGTSSQRKEEEKEWLRLSIGRSTDCEVSSPKMQLAELNKGRARDARGKLESDFHQERTNENRYSSLEVNWGPVWNSHTAKMSAPPAPPALSTQPHPNTTERLLSSVSISIAREQNNVMSSGMRVISPPLRAFVGVWFLLQASQNQAREPFLPQIPKCYLRIKDGRMTVRLLMKYLVNKLSLNKESEVEITCRGEQLHPLLTLQQVRDGIWCARDGIQLPPEFPGQHIMILFYGRSP
ncbi:uncharacterized protein LOC144705586 [Wolffia australiana]